MSGTVAQILTSAAGQIGYTEVDNNITKYWSDLIRWHKAASSYQGQPWCAAFEQWNLYRFGMWFPADYPFYVPSLRSAAISRGAYSTTPRPGELAFFRFGYTTEVHTGFVEKVLDSTHIQTIEGNTSSGTSGSQNNGGGVYRRIRRSDWGVAGYGRPAYASAPAPAPSSGWTLSDVRTFQGRLRTTVDGHWGSNTDTRALAVRSVAYAAVPSTTNQIKLCQSIIGVTDDGVVGPNTRSALATWVRNVQPLLHVTADGAWGPNTDSHFLAFRKQWLGR